MSEGPTGGVGGIRGTLGVTYQIEDDLLQSTLDTQDGLLQTIAHELRSMGPKLVPLLATTCLYLGELRGHMRGMGWGYM